MVDHGVECFCEKCMCLRAPIRRQTFEEAADAVRNACKHCDRPIKTRVIGDVVKAGQRLPVHQLDDNLVECPNCGPATAAIRALANKQSP